MITKPQGFVIHRRQDGKSTPPVLVLFQETRGKPMLKEAMLAMRVTDMDYAPEICRLLKSAEMDLRIAGVTIEGTCAFDIAYTQDPEDPTITDITVEDNSTITDEMVQTAMITYCRAHFGSPPDYQRLADSYDLQRRQLANATGYINFGEGEGS